ncbi:DNA-binding protein [Dysgonomonas sp. 520]|uniref:DNA-binding protein n=1 Tax=Dysgonomonas sp. 520 TaxID=2302931 RepID=UPI0013D7C824|nr:DNA-binding protein [Dysgonomonas sp. 520]NDW08989.1 DNA-binding protein [Dysgonomonas sp. 520]
MPMTITFSELRQVKDNLPDGSMQKIADELNISVETVRNYFGGSNYSEGQSCGLHIEPGPNGGYVIIDDLTIWDMAKNMLEQHKVKQDE